VSDVRLPEDPLWPRAAAWLGAPVHATAPADAAGAPLPAVDFALIGIPAHATSITPTSAHTTPAAVRDALLRYSTYAASHDVDVATLSACDFGDIAEPDGELGEARVTARVAQIAASCELLVAIGGDNSITYSAMRGVFSAEVGGLEAAGLVTLDAHHDLRDGISNGSPVRRLIADGLDGRRVAQVGIADFSNSAEYARRARDLGITVISRDELRRVSLADTVACALDVASPDGRDIYVDLDVDVCDRAVVPGCPAAAPGGLSADELRQVAFLCARDPRVRAIDLAEIDAAIDTPDRRTVRLAALLVLEAAAGLCVRMREQGLSPAE
jgi:formiminoglutamase